MGRSARALAFYSGLLLLVLLGGVDGWRPWPSNFNNTAKAGVANVSAVGHEYGVSKRYEGSSEFVHMRYHNGPVFTSNITVHTIWYGNWNPVDKRIIKDFLLSISDGSKSKSPSVNEWWKTIQLYTDQTGANISRNVIVGPQINDRYSHGKALTRLSIQEVIKSAVTAQRHPLPIDPKNGLYLLLTSSDVIVQDFCRAWRPRARCFAVPTVTALSVLASSPPRSSRTLLLLAQLRLPCDGLLMVHDRMKRRLGQDSPWRWGSVPFNY